MRRFARPIAWVVVACSLNSLATAASPTKRDIGTSAIGQPQASTPSSNSNLDATHVGTGRTPPQISNGNYQAQLGLQKTNARSLALQVISNYDPSSPQYTKARGLYADAQSKFNNFTSIMLTNYILGNKIDLTQTANQASAASKSFSDYVFSLKPGTKSVAMIPVVASVLVDVGEKLWDYFSSKQEAKRQALADAIRPQITWDDWESLVSS